MSAIILQCHFFKIPLLLSPVLLPNAVSCSGVVGVGPGPYIACHVPWPGHLLNEYVLVVVLLTFLFFKIDQGFTPALLNIGRGEQKLLPSIRDGHRVIVDSPELSAWL